MDDQLDNASVPGENCSTRKRGRPAVVVTEEVIQRRRISRQRVNAARPKREGPSKRRGGPKDAVNRGLSNTRVNPCQGDGQTTQETGGESSTRKRGRPPIVLTAEVIEQRRLSRKRINASRSKREGPSKKRGRPKSIVQDRQSHRTVGSSPDSVPPESQASDADANANPGCGSSPSTRSTQASTTIHNTRIAVWVVSYIALGHFLCIFASSF
ncbi:hypothetical protein DCAR_0101397 [Daucus carota subsp. sativus]|uniref:Uncharacterized protein n=1 Tax=Daucus carota subsp. sativus TaxID=79200 RepID=A0A162AGL4_DAUCS|nr:hypothetical protein DCAR_0101397 [Daucus carota subsp. sativus]